MRKIITVKTLLKIEAVWGQGVKINPKAFARTEAVPGNDSKDSPAEAVPKRAEMLQ